MAKPKKKKRRAKFSQNELFTYGFTRFLTDLFDQMELDYEVDEETNQTGNPVIHITCEHLYGFFTIGARTGFKGALRNNGLVNWIIKEGFEEKDLNKFNIWINFDDEEKFFYGLLPKEYQKKFDNQ